MRQTTMKNQTRYWWKTIASFLLVLFTMPLGHALMIMMEHLIIPTALHYTAFAMGGVGLLMVIIGVFARNDTKQTLWDCSVACFLDRLGRVFIYVLCQPIRSTARNAKWRSSNTTGISDYADLIRILGYVHGALSI